MLVRSGILFVLAALVVGFLGPVGLLAADPALAAPCTDAQTNAVLVGGFEIDGNLCTNTTGTTGPREWDTAGTQPVASDPEGSADGSAFSGTNEDAWPWTVGQTSGSNPAGNADITKVFAYSQVAADDHVYAYFGWERAATQGTVGFYVELNQKPNLRGPVPDRSDGDLRLRFIQQGNTLLTLDGAYLWSPTGPTSGTWDPISVGPYEARVNAGAVSNLPGLTPNPMPAGTFAEAAVDLTGLFAGAGECSGRLGYMNLRSASSLGPAHPPLSDWVEPVRLGVPPTCPTVVLRKHWINGADGDTAGLSINSATTAPGANTSTAGDQGDFLDTGHHATAEVEPGSTVTVAESLGAGNTGTYTSSLTCDSDALSTVNGTSGTFVMPPDAGAGDTVTCTVTNTRTSALLTLTKIWGTSTAGDTVGLSIEAGSGSTGPTTSTAPTSTSITQTVLSGEGVTVVETPGDANTASYQATTTCTGVDGFTSAEFGGSFTVPDDPGAMSCTITNTAIPAELTLLKHWVHGAAGDTAGLTLTDGGQTDSAVAHVPAGGNGDSAEAASLPILPGDTVTLSEVLPAAGNTNSGLYHPASLTCNGQNVPFDSSTTGANATATATYHVGSSAAVTCTITNQPRYRVVLTKVWGANAVPGDQAHLTVTNTTTSASGTQTAVAPNPPPTPASVIASGGDHITASETVEGSGTYASAVECNHGARTVPAANGSASLVVPTNLTAGTTIVCTATNSARYRVTLTKAWHGDFVAGDAAHLTVHNVTTGQTAGPTTARAPHPPTTVPSVSASANDLIDVRETLGVADIGTYDHRLACSAGSFTTPSATTMGEFEVPADLPAGTTVACTLTNTARATAPGAHPARPHVRTVTSRHRVTPGRAFRDRVHVRGLAAGHRARAVARLYGPFASRAAASCTAGTVVRERRLTVRNGWRTTAPVRVHAPGVYTWRVTVLPSAANRRATHPCGQAAETTTVAKAGYGAPDVNGGFDGTLLPGTYRAAPVTLAMPAIGMSALVRTERIARGAMVLPLDVSEVGWLRSSAGVGDAIGTTVIGGHVSDRHDRPGALYHLDRARVGQVITIRRGGVTHRFVVTGTRTYVRGTRLPRGYFATTGPHRLVLISCSDRVVYPDGRFHYTRSLVVEARPAR